MRVLKICCPRDSVGSFQALGAPIYGKSQVARHDAMKGFVVASGLVSGCLLASMLGPPEVDAVLVGLCITSQLPLEHPHM